MKAEVMENNEKKNSKFMKFAKKFIKGKLLIALLILIAVTIISFGIGKSFFSDKKVAKLGFADIGEFATQSVKCTEISIMEKERELFGTTIPFTQSKYIYSYDVEIKAGFDFAEIGWEANNKTKEIIVVLPKAKVLSNEIDTESFKVYHEKNNIFSRIELKELNSDYKELKEKAQNSAVENGLLDKATDNAKNLISVFILKEDTYKDYEIVFE